VGRARDIGAEIAEEAILQSVDPAVDGEILVPRPSVLDDGGLADVGDLLDDVELAEAMGAGGVIG